MTPCEKLGYKVGDKFEVAKASQGFGKGQVVTLFQDDGSESPMFKGNNTRYSNASGAPGAYLMLSHVKPLTVTTLNKSKTWLATALIEAGVTKFPEGADWAAQDKVNEGGGATGLSDFIRVLTLRNVRRCQPVCGGATVSNAATWWVTLYNSPHSTLSGTRPC